MIASSPRVSLYRQRNEFLSFSWTLVLSLVSHLSLLLQLSFILSRSICIIFKFKYTVFSFLSFSKPCVYSSALVPLIVSVISFLQSALVACFLTEISHIPHLFYNSRDCENNVKVHIRLCENWSKINTHPLLSFWKIVCLHKNFHKISFYEI